MDGHGSVDKKVMRAHRHATGGGDTILPPHAHFHLPCLLFPTMATTAEAQPDGQEKKKKRVIITPPCPPSVATGYLLLRGATLGVVGASMSEATVSLMQPTFIKENPVLSGKFTVSLGKKLGCGELQLPESSQGQEELLNAIQAAANRMIQQAPTVRTTRLSKQEILETYGEHVLDASHKKTKPQDVLNVAFIEDVVLAVPPALPFASTLSLSKIVIERGNLASSITCGKKARKAEVTLKFHVEVNGDKNAPESVPAALDDIDVSSLNQTKVRMPEGLVMLEQQQTAAQVETVTETINDVAMKDAQEARDDSDGVGSSRKD